MVYDNERWQNLGLQTIALIVVAVGSRIDFNRHELHDTLQHLAELFTYERSACTSTLGLAKAVGK